MKSLRKERFENINDRTQTRIRNKKFDFIKSKMEGTCFTYLLLYNELAPNLVE